MADGGPKQKQNLEVRLRFFARVPGAATDEVFKTKIPADLAGLSAVMLSKDLPIQDKRTVA